jgi:hypothetical protein
VFALLSFSDQSNDSILLVPGDPICNDSSLPQIPQVASTDVNNDDIADHLLVLHNFLCILLPFT